MKTVCAYIRVSTESQEEYSPDAQVRLLKEYAAANDMSLVHIYKDLGISGRTAEKRPEFIQMISDAKSKEHPYDAILVWKFSRFARNQEESIVYKSLLKRNGIEVISVSEPLPDGFIGELVERIFEWMDEYYSIRLSGEVKRGMNQKAMSGGYNGQPPIGYLKEKGSTTVPYPDKEYAAMVQLIFHMVGIDHKSLTYVARHINELGYRTRRGNRWESRNIVDMIQNPFYIGKIRWNSSKSRNPGRDPNAPEIIRDGKHEPIITKEIWDKANSYYNEIYQRTNHGKRNDAYKHWLSGILKCPTCGSTLAYQSGLDHKTGKKHPYFVCYRSTKGSCSTRNSIGISKAENDVMSGLKNIIENMNIAEIAPKPQLEVADSSEIRINQLKNKLSRIRAAYINGIDSLEEYKASKEKIEQEIQSINNKKEQTTLTQPSIDELRVKLKKVYDFIASSNDTQAKSDSIHSIIDRIVYEKTTDSMKFYLK